MTHTTNTHTHTHTHAPPAPLACSPDPELGQGTGAEAATVVSMPKELLKPPGVQGWLLSKEEAEGKEMGKSEGIWWAMCMGRL